MPAVPLVTSIPPRMKRSLDGREIGPDYLGMCIASWQACGLHPVSVNSAKETPHGAAWSRNVEIVEMPVDAERDAQRPLVFFSDFLEAAGKVATGGVVAITNADVLLRSRAVVEQLCERVTPTRAVVARRVDVENPIDAEGTPYYGGFDFFAVHASQLAKIADIGLIFGAPWWDYYLPIALLAQGVEVELTGQAFAYHLQHTERWNAELWQAMGERFRAGVASLMEDAPRQQAASMFAQYRTIFESVGVVNPERFFSALRRPVRDRRALISSLGIGKAAQRDRLARLALETVTFFDRALAQV